MTSVPPTGIRSMLLTALALGLMTWTAAASTPTAHADGPDETITWAVNPADPSGERDGRAWVDLTLDPGDTVTEHMAVRNLSSRDATFELAAADGYFTGTGRFTMLDDPGRSTGAGTWITIEAEVDVAAGATAVVPFTISVPADAPPGDHPAGVAASHLASGGAAGEQLQVQGRVGFRVMTRVTGELRTSVAVVDRGTRYATEWNPLEPGVVDVEVLLSNEGNTAVTLDGVTSVAGNVTTLSHVDGAPTIELLPGESRVVVASIDGVWPLGWLDVGVQVIPTVDGVSAQSAPIRASVRVWALPWPQALSVAGLGLVAAGVLLERQRRRNHVEQLVTAARAEARAEVLAMESSSSATEIGKRGQ